jgi:hypothetical protein
MKNFILLFLTLATSSVFSQTLSPPQAFTYSAVARNASGQPIANAPIGIQISILKNASNGDIQYTENHVVNTDAFGLFNLIIGGGAIQSGAMNAINWSDGIYFLEVGMDVNGGINFTTMGTTQFLSVPYALHAKTAESISGGGSANNANSHYIGEFYENGVIFHLWKDAQGVEHGLIVDIQDISNAQSWSNVFANSVGSESKSVWNGLNNSLAIISQSGHENSAAKLCLDSTNQGANDWYLPSIQELNLLWNQYYTISRVLSEIQGASLLHEGYYWSSTETDAYSAWNFDFSYGAANYNDSSSAKNNLYHVRAIRSF